MCNSFSNVYINVSISIIINNNIIMIRFCKYAFSGCDGCVGAYEVGGCVGAYRAYGVGGCVGAYRAYER